MVLEANQHKALQKKTECCIRALSQEFLRPPLIGETRHGIRAESCKEVVLVDEPSFVDDNLRRSNGVFALACFSHLRSVSSFRLPIDKSPTTKE